MTGILLKFNKMELERCETTLKNLRKYNEFLDKYLVLCNEYNVCIPFTNDGPFNHGDSLTGLNELIVNRQTVADRQVKNLRENTGERIKKLKYFRKIQKIRVEELIEEGNKN